MDFSFDSPAAGGNDRASASAAAPSPPEPHSSYSRAQSISASVQYGDPDLDTDLHFDDDKNGGISVECSKLTAQCIKLMGDNDQQGHLADFIVNELIGLRHLVATANVNINAGMTESDCVRELISKFRSGSAVLGSKHKRKRMADNDDNQDLMVYGGSINDVSAEMLRDAELTKSMTDRILQSRAERPFSSVEDFKTRVKGFGDLKMSKLQSKGIYIVAPKPPALLPNES